MFCSRCGTSLADGSQFCVECGHTVEGSFPAAPAPSGDRTCSHCSKTVSPGVRFCPNCGHLAPPPTLIASADGSAAAAPATAYEAIPWRARRALPVGKIASWLAGIALFGAVAWLVTTNNSLAPQIKDYLTTAHAETITDGSIAIKPHGFATYKISVPEGAIDVAVSGQFEANGRADNNVEVLLVTDGEFVVWQGGYAISPFYDSGNVAQANMQATLPSRSGTYYLIFSNKPSRTEKTVHVTAGLRYDTWLPDGLVSLKAKVLGWFE